MEEKKSSCMFCGTEESVDSRLSCENCGMFVSWSTQNHDPQFLYLKAKDKVAYYDDCFFIRGNIAASWENIEEMYNVVTVDLDGYVAKHTRNVNKNRSDAWEGCLSRMIGWVGFDCQDWEHLKFYRPGHEPQEEKHLPDGFWEAVRLLYGKEYEWVRFTDSENPIIYCHCPYGRMGMVSGLPIDTLVVEGVDYKNSTTRYPYLRIGQTEEEIHEC